MFYAVYALALFLGLFFPAYLVSESIGWPITMYWDIISLIVTVGASYLLVASGSGSLNIFTNNDHLALWGDLCLKMGYIGFFLGVVGILAGMTSLDPSSVGHSCAIAVLTILYGLVFKYMIIVPWITCRKNCKLSE